MHFRAMRSSCWAAVRVLDGRWPWMSRIDAVRGTFAPLHPVGTHQHPADVAYAVTRPLSDTCIAG